MSRPKDIGTRVESEVVKAFHRAGLPAHRNALAGHLDEGDVHALDGSLVIECKGGQQTKQVSWSQLHAWLAETEKESTRVVRCDLGLLVVKRWGSGSAEDWHAHTWLDDLTTYLGGTTNQPHLPITLRLGDLLTLITNHTTQKD